MVMGPVLKHLFYCRKLNNMLSFQKSFYRFFLFLCNKIQVAFTVYGWSVPVHFHFGYHAQTTSKDFVK